MRTRRISTATAFAVLFSSVVLVGGVASPAAADSRVDVPVTWLSDSVLDGVHQRLFLSDRSSGKIVAIDFTGRTLATIPGLPQVTDLALSPDAATVYAAVPGADKIVAVDTATLRVTAQYPTGQGTEPSTVAYADGRLWFGHGRSWDSALGSVDLTGAEPVVALDQGAGFDWSTPPTLHTDPLAPGTLVAVDSGISSGPIVIYDITTGVPAIRLHEGKGGFVNDVDFTPDGANIIVAGRRGPSVAEYRLSDLAELRTFPGPGQGASVAVAPDGTVATGTADWFEDPDLYVYTRGSGQPGSTRNLHDTTGLAERGLHWSPDGSKLFALHDAHSGSTTPMTMLTAPRSYVTTTTASAPAKATRAKALTGSGRTSASLPLPSGTQLAVTRTDLESPKGKAIGSAKVDAKGFYTFKDTPPTGGRVTYKVAFVGDASHTKSSATASVAVSRAATTLKLNRNKSLHAYDKNVSFTATLGKTHKNRVVELWADPFGADKPKKLIKKAKVNSQGNLSATVTMKRDTTVTAVFAGDGRYAPKSVKSTAYAQVKVSTTLSRHYRTAKIGKTTYAYYSKKKNPDFTTSMTYYQGRAQKLSLEVNYQGKWYDVGQHYFPLGSNGKSIVTLEGPHETGYKMRVRSSYINGSSGDSVNSTTHGAWKYFIFTK
ncbi:MULTISPECIES: Ig-like domain repeat protein [unclassified Streptomyces]|uniref:WD40 repeat domain-containing protein n=1 Tax=unclassified Streptomyces TaxID=2593676 RepID=UPI00344D7E5E